MAAAVIIVYKTAILYETNIRLNYYNIYLLYCIADATIMAAVVSGGGSIIILQW